MRQLENTPLADPGALSTPVLRRIHGIADVDRTDARLPRAHHLLAETSLGTLEVILSPAALRDLVMMLDLRASAAE